MSSEPDATPEAASSPAGRRGKLFIVSGPSGSGKSTLLSQLFAALPGLEYSVSTTTRPQRPGERDGVDYHYTDTETFRKLVEQGEFIEHATVHGNEYGTRRSTVEAALSRGVDLVLDIDVQGAREIRKCFKEAILIFMMPPSLRVLEQRLRSRKTESDEALERRLKNAEREMQSARDYDYIIVNDKVETAAGRLAEIIRVERMRSGAAA